MFQVEPTWKPWLPRDRDLGTAADATVLGERARVCPGCVAGCAVCFHGSVLESGRAGQRGIRGREAAGGAGGRRVRALGDLCGLWHESGDDNLIGTS